LHPNAAAGFPSSLAIFRIGACLITVATAADVSAQSAPQQRALPGVPARDVGPERATVPLTPLPSATPRPVLLFRDIRVTVLGFTTARIEWAPYIGGAPVAKYRVLKGGVPIAEVLPPTLTLTDTTLRNDTSYTYAVQAIGAPRTINVIPGSAPPGTNPKPTTIPGPVLETSNVVSAMTPALLPPASVTAEVDPGNPNLIRLSWTPVAGAKSYQIVRNSRVLNGFSQPFADTVPGPGWYDYSVATVVAESGLDAVSTASKAVSIHTGPFTVLAFGDSVVWGQGLAETHKFTALVRQWLNASLSYPVELKSFAHSGAHLTPHASDPVTVVPQLEAHYAATLTILSPGAPVGEVPNQYPTIRYQAIYMGPTAVDPSNVDLIVMDGCINDVGVKTILDPIIQGTDLQTVTDQYCGGEMLAVLEAVHTKYKRAKIVVVGYFPIASKQSDSIILNEFAGAEGLQLTTSGGAVLQNDRDTMIDHSSLFAKDSAMRLSAAVDGLNSAATQRVAVVASVAFGDQNAYAAPQTWLWLIPAGANPNDEVYDARSVACDLLSQDMTGSSDHWLCAKASMGHPNVLGAQLFAITIESQLKSFLTEWRRNLAKSQAAR
jgi:hypothetical protein